jgi:hypothetical protein
MHLLFWLVPTMVCMLLLFMLLLNVLVFVVGFLYAINGKSGCVDAIDVGGEVLAAPLIDDLDGNGLLDVLVVTQAGDVYCLGTRAPYHPLKTVLSGHRGYRQDSRGIYVLRERNSVRHVSGSHFRFAIVTFCIADRLCF